MNTKVKTLEDALRLYPNSNKVQVLVGEHKYYIESVYLEDYSNGKHVVVLKLEGNPL